MNAPLATVLDAVRALPPTGDLRTSQAAGVVEAYAHELARFPADSAGIGDAASLPFAKDAIRHALLTLLAALPAPGHREALRLAYIRLADWQPEDPPVEPIDLASARGSRDPLAMASRLAASRAPAAERRRAAAVRERARLVDELRRLGFG
jgi:hypothetical protein